MKAYFIFVNVFGYVMSLDFKNISTFPNILELVKMSHNVYYRIDSSHWLNVTLTKVRDLSITNNTVRAYLFSNDDGTENVVSFKGTSTFWTSLSVHEENEPDSIKIKSLTARNDKYNDNLYYSCCFYKQSKLFKCDNKCENGEFDKKVNVV